jgi:phosphatidate cytidylyltransferase
MLKARVFTAIVLMACFIPALFYMPSYLWAYLMLALSLIAVFEWGGMIGLNGKLRAIYVLLAGVMGILTILLMHQVGFHGFLPIALNLFLLVALFWVLIVPVWLTQSWQIKNQWLLSALGLLLIGSLWLALVSAKQIDPWILLTIISTIWIADSAAYFAGKQFGKRKLAPSISPGKTWEGVWGALISVSLFALVIWLLNGFESLLIVPGLCLIALLGVYGDLFESMFKRQANLKDSGNILPGHGGILDRIDGVIPAMPIGVLMLYLYYFTVSLQ